MIRSIALIGMLFSKSLSASAETWHICTMVERMSRDDSVTVMKSHLGCIVVPVVPHKAVAEVSKIENNRRGELL